MNMPIERSFEVDHRDEFPMFCNWRRLYTNAVEVGVDRGEYSNHFLNVWSGGEYYGVDTYHSSPEIPWNREADFQMAAIRYERHARRARLLRCESRVAAQALHTIPYVREFDWVYIDAGHDFESVMADIQTWWPLVSSRGVLAGHDYDPGHPGVIQAVNKFFANATVYLTHEAHIPSWYVYKSGIPGPTWRRLP